MFKTLIGEYNYLAVVVYDDPLDESNHVWYDKENEVRVWMSAEDALKKKSLKHVMVVKDKNYLLNEMVMNQKNRKGQALYDIYTGSFKEDDQMKKIIEFWKNKDQ